MTPVGKFLRKTSLDKLPQLINIIQGEMSVVGPGSALYNQYDLIELRTKAGVDILIPGFTGWAQINGRDELSIPVKVEFDEYYLKRQSILLDIKILFWTIYKVAKADWKPGAPEKYINMLINISLMAMTHAVNSAIKIASLKCINSVP